MDASALFGVIAQMGSAICKIQEDLQTPPPWVSDVSEKLKRMDTLDRGFSSLTDVVGEPRGTQTSRRVFLRGVGAGRAPEHLGDNFGAFRGRTDERSGLSRAGRQPHGRRQRHGQAGRF